MESIIERPWSEDGWKDFRSGTKYYSPSKESNRKDSSKAEDDSTSEGSNMEYSYSEGGKGGDYKWEVILEGDDDVNMKIENMTLQRECDYCGGDDHFYTCCKLQYGVPKGAYVTPAYRIVCEWCGEEMKNDLLCPRCNCEVPSVLVPTFCYYCYSQGHEIDLCPDKQMNLPPHPETIPLPADFDLETYEPSSP